MPQIPAPPLTLPILRALLNRANLALLSLDITSPTPTGFSLSLTLSLTRCGPFPALVTFPSGLSLWDPATDTPIGSSSASVPLDLSFPSPPPIKPSPAGEAGGVLGSVRIRGGKCPSATLVAGIALDPTHGHAWLNHVLLSDPAGGVPVQVRAKARVTAIGFRWKRVDVVKEVRFGGLAGLNGALRPASSSSRNPVPPSRAPASTKTGVRIDGLEILPASSARDGIVCTAKIALSNPSNELSLALEGPLALDLFASASPASAKLGTATIPRLQVPRGGKPSVLQTDIRLDPNAAGVEGSEFITAFLAPADARDGLQLRARGAKGKEGWLPKLLNGVELLANLPPLPKPVLQDVSISFAAGTATSASSAAHVRVTLYNPFACPLRLRRLSVTFSLPASPPLGHLRGAASGTGDMDVALREKATTTTGVDETVVEMDMDPANLVRVLRSAAGVKGTDLSGIEGVLRLAEGRRTEGQAGGETRGAEGKKGTEGKKGKGKAKEAPVDLVRVVGDALKGLKVDVSATASLVIGGPSPPPPKPSPALPHHVQPQASSFPAAPKAEGGEKGGYRLEDVRLTQRGVPAEIGEKEVGKVVDRVAEPIASGLLEAASISLRRLRLLPKAEGERGGMVNGIVEGGKEEGTEVEMEIEVAGLEALGAMEATVSFEGGLEMEWGGKRAARLVLRDPLIVSGSGESVNALRGNLVVDDVPRFARLVRTLATSASLNIRTSCPSLSLVVAGVRIAPRPFAKPILVNGLDSLSGLKLDSFDLPRDCDPAKGEGEGIKVEAEGVVEVRSALELDIEEIEVDLLYLEGDVGTATIRDLSLRRGGTSRFLVNGKLDGRLSSRSLRALGSLISDVLSSDGVVLTASIRAIHLADGADLPWLSEGLRQVPVSIPISLPPTAAGELLQEVQLNTVGLTFRDGSTFPALTCDDVWIKIRSPFGFPLGVRRVGGALGLRWRDVPAGKVDLPDADVRAPGGKAAVADGASDRTTIARIGFADAPLLEPDADVLSSFAAAAVDAEHERLGIDGSGLRIVVGTAAGEVTLAGVPVMSEASVKGLKGIRHMPAQLTEVRVAKGEKDNLKVTMKAWFNSPGQIRVRAEEVTERISLPVFYGPASSSKDLLIGRAVLAPTFNIDPGPTHIPISFEYAPRPEQAKQAGILLSDFLSGRTSTLRIRGDDDSATSRVLCEALKKIEMDAVLKPMADKTLIQSVAIALGLNVAVKNVDATFCIANPFELPLRLRKVVATVTHRGQPFGSLAPVFRSFVVGPASGPKIPTLATSPSFIVKLRQPLDKLVKSWGQARANLLLDIDLEADVEIGEYAIKGFKYRQERLPLRIQGLEGVTRFLSYFPL